MANQSQIIQQLQSNPALAAMSDADVATQLSIPTLNPVPYPTFQAGVMQLASWAAISAAAAQPTTTNPQILGPCLVAVQLMTAYGSPNVDMRLAAFQAMMSGLEAAGLLSSADAQAILAMGQSYSCGGIVATADVTAARAAMVQQAAATILYQKISAGNLAAIAAVDAGVASGTLPTSAQLIAAFTGSIS